MRANENQKKALEAVNENAQIVKRALDNPNGKALMKLLKQQFGGPLLGTDPHDTYYRLGAFDLYNTLLNHLEWARREENDA